MDKIPSRHSNRLAGIALVFSVLAAMAPSGLFAGDESGAAISGAADSNPAGLSRLEPVPQPAAASPNPLAPVLAELSALRDSVRTEEQRLDEHARELEAERADLADQLDRIAKLEFELRAVSATAGALSSPAQPKSTSTTLAFGTPPAPQAGAGNSSAVASAQTQAPVQGSVDRRLSDLERRMKGLGPLTFSGDFRLREDAFFGGPSDHSLDENLQNYRLRFNTDVRITQDISGGFTLASGNINDPTSTNQTLTGFYARKPIALDRVFIDYHPRQFKPLDLIAGKFSYPWYNTELTWDKDLSPEGFGQTLNFQLATPVLKRVALVGFELPFSQVAGVSLQNRSLMQTATYGAQFQAGFELTDWLQLTAYTGFYNFHNADPMAFALAKASSKNPATPFVGLLPLTGGGGVPQNSM